MTEMIVGLDMSALSNTANCILKGIRPRYDQDGDRVFIYQNKTVRLTLTSFINQWQLVREVQTGLPFDPTLKAGFVVFSSTNSSFMYHVNDTKVYGYCESLMLEKCTAEVILPCTIKFPFCQLCNHIYTECTQCTNGYTLVKNQCV
jgi:hypothetical protein